MAIQDMKGTVTTTGKMDQAPKTPSAPNLSGMNTLFNRKQPAPVSAPIKDEPPVQQAEVAQVPTNDLIARVYRTILEPICYWAAKR